VKSLFILLYNDKAGGRESVKAAVDACPHIYTWRYDLPHSFYLVSESDAKTIATWLRKKMPSGQFSVIKADTTDFWGWGYTETWYLFRNKKNMPKEAS
jgi:hypothetical protein